MGRPKVALVGVGSVGGTVAAALHHADRCDLTLIARGETLSKLQQEGLTVRQPFRDDGSSVEYHCMLPCISSSSTHELGPQDFLFVVTKAHHFPALLDSLLPLVGPGTAVVPCMNGIPFWYNYFHAPADPAGFIASVDPDGRLWELVGPENAIGAVVKVGGHVAAPGVTVQAGPGTLEFGEPDGSDSARLGQLVDLFGNPRSAASPAILLNVVKRAAIREAMWDKLVFNVVGNVLTTLTQSTNGDAAADPLLRHIHSLMVDEVATLCAGLSPPIQLRVTAEKYLSAMEGSDHKASTLQDLLAGRPFEKDALVTAVQEVARSAGVATPYIDFAGALLQALERNAVLAKL